MHTLRLIFVPLVALLSALFMIACSDSKEPVETVTAEGQPKPSTVVARAVPTPVAEAVDEDSADRVVDAALGSGPLNDQRRLLRVDEAISAERYDDAMEMLEPLIESGNKPIETNLLLTEIYLAQGNFPYAIGTTDQIIELDPKNTQAYYQRAQARIGIEEYAEAIADISSYIDLMPRGEMRDHAIDLRDQWDAILHPQQ